MTKKLTITVSDEVYEGLHRRIGRRKISRFIRRERFLPPASFRFHLAMDTLAVQLAVPLAGPAWDLNPQESARCRAHKKKKRMANHPLLKSI